MEQTNKKIIKRSQNFIDWYTSVINEAELIQYTDVKGAMIFKPKGWVIWENIQKILDQKFKEVGCKNVSMPTLIPIEEFEKEKDHVEGFAPELFTVNQIGEKVLNKKMCLRPTAEIWFCKYFENEIKSYKNLPIKVNQWCNVFRAEKNTRPFLRNSEFYWQELHCAFSNSNDANNFAKEILDIYAELCEKYLAIPVIKGQKTNREKFAGGDITYTIESMMQDGQALQSATSHYLGQNFSKAYDIKFQDKNNELKIAYTTSHGLTTRIIGAIIMVHSDDNGLVLPFSIAETQINIIPLLANKNPEINEYAQKIYNRLKNNYRCSIYNDSDKSLGYILSESETNGIPVNIIIGPNDLKNNTYTCKTRISNEKQIYNFDNILDDINKIVLNYHSELYTKAKKRLDENIIDVKNFEEFKEVINNSRWARCYFDDNDENEQKIKEITGATARCIVEHNSPITKKCFYSGKDTNRIVIFAKAY
ncbi:MAG: proline--tRNA ligase [Ureaplasma sp.]|nr:proline--tRNA ligase [Ureaplasma sp.]